MLFPLETAGLIEAMVGAELGFWAGSLFPLETAGLIEAHEGNPRAGRARSYSRWKQRASLKQAQPAVELVMLQQLFPLETAGLIEATITLTDRPPVTMLFPLETAGLIEASCIASMPRGQVWLFPLETAGLIEARSAASAMACGRTVIPAGNSGPH